MGSKQCKSLGITIFGLSILLLERFGTPTTLLSLSNFRSPLKPKQTKVQKTLLSPKFYLLYKVVFRPSWLPHSARIFSTFPHALQTEFGKNKG